jgi:hypothetical protein
VDSSSTEGGTNTTNTTDFDHLFRLSLPNYTIAALDDSYSPQYKAFQWVTTAASDHVLPVTEDDQLARMTQRFALATLYYATDGTN